MPKRILSGTVVSANSNKTIVVKVTRRVKHKLYKKLSVYQKIITSMTKIIYIKVVTKLALLNQNQYQNKKKWMVVNNNGDQK